jgi:hypothetical protein
VQLGLENKKKTMWAVGLAVVALLAGAYEFMPMFMGPTPVATSNAPVTGALDSRAPSRRGGKPGKKTRPENLDPTLRLNLLASSEQTMYEGNGRNIFVSQAEVIIPQPGAPGNTDAKKAEEEAKYRVPTPPPPTPIPLKFFGFANRPGEPKKIFLSKDQDVFIAGEGEIVDRRYKVVRISPTNVEIQDVVNSGPPQSIPLTPG